MNESGSSKASGDDAARRSFLVQFAAVVCGGLVALFPFAAGLGVVIDPWRRGRRAASTGGTSGPVDANGVKFVRICSLDALQDDGVPRAFPVISDVVDGWTQAANQRIGMIFLKRAKATGQPNVIAFNAACPHLGCFVDFNPADGNFECPCHKSAFNKDGKQLYGPSRRGMDPLEVRIEDTGEQAEILVAFENFLKGIPERKPVE